MHGTAGAAGAGGVMRWAHGSAEEAAVGCSFVGRSSRSPGDAPGEGIPHRRLRWPYPELTAIAPAPLRLRLLLQLAVERLPDCGQQVLREHRLGDEALRADLSCFR